MSTTPTHCGWRTWQVLCDEVQVYPRHDLVAHELTEDQCPCGPAVELIERPGQRDAYLFVHQALDGRE